jgi:hypothetical protein
MEHPLVGVWTLRAKYQGRPETELATHSYHADGSMSMSTAGYAGHGVWVPTSERSARARIMASVGPSEGQTAWYEFQASLEVSPDGQTLSLTGSLARPTPSGVPTEWPAAGSGDRLSVDGPAG